MTWRGWELPREGLYWLFAAAGLGFTGWLKNINLILLLAYLMLALWGLNVVVASWDLRNLRARRSSFGPIYAGIATPWQIEVQAEQRGPSRTGWTIEDHGPSHDLNWFVTWWNGEPLHLRQEVILPQRGAYSIAPLIASSRYPFGLVRHQVTLAPAETRIVLPRLGRVDGEVLRDWLLRASRGDGRSHSMVRHVATQEAEIHGLRPFRLGDSPRWIHWRTSARRNELMVREYENQPSPDLILVVEPVGDVEAIDRLISLAATICREWCREPNLRMTLILARSEPEAIQGRTRSEFAFDLLHSLAVEPGGVAVEARQVIDRFPPSWRSTPVLVLTTQSHSALVRQLEQRLGRPVPEVFIDELPFWYEPPSPIGQSNQGGASCN